MFKEFLSRALAALLFSPTEPFVQFKVEGIIRNHSEIIFNLDKWFRCHLKDLSGALAALEFDGAEPFVHFEGISWETFM